MRTLSRYGWWREHKKTKLLQKNKTLRQDIVSLKQTKNFKRYIDAYPLVGTGGGGKIKNKILRQDIVSLKQTKNKEILS